MSKKIKRYKVGTDSETYAISMVEMPAIESDFVALAEQKEDKVQVFLESDERHMVYGAALIPDKDIYRNNGEQEFYISFTKESIEKMSQDFMKNYRQNEVTLDHEEMANDITITESWLVEDTYKDKANALGINVPNGTWMIGMKVNQIDVWDRIKSGELKGFSVESMISLEEFSKQKENNMIETNDEMFFDKIKNAFREVLASVSLAKREEIEPISIEDLAANSGLTVDEYNKEVASIKEELDILEELEEEPKPAVEPTPEPQPTVEEPTVEEPKPEPQPVVEEPTVEEPKPQDNHLEELINNLKSEIESLKEMNSGLQDKIKDLGKQPSVQPLNPNAKPSQASNYSAWREQMRQMMG